MSECRARLRIGVLAIQGAFFEHRAALLKAAKNSTFSKSVDVEVLDVREAHQLSDLDGLILPGGESTTMSLFLQSSNFEDVLKDWVASKEKPRVVWGTCAGLILLSNDIEGQKEGGQSKVEISKQGLSCTVSGEWGTGEFVLCQTWSILQNQQRAPLSWVFLIFPPHSSKVYLYDCLSQDCSLLILKNINNYHKAGEVLLFYNNQINAHALIGQSAMVYCAGKLMEKLHVF